MNLQPGVDEERDAPDDRAEVFGRHLARRLHRVEHGLRGGEREGQLLHRRRARLLQMIGAHVGRVPLRHRRAGEDDRVLDEPQRRLGREHVGAAREIFLDDVVLDRAGELLARRALLVGDADVERQQPRRRGVDGHRRVHVRRAGCRRAACACRRGARPARRPCRPRRGPARGRSRSRSASADRRRWRGPSAPWRGSCGRARWTWRPSSGRRRCGTARACRARPVAAAARASPLFTGLGRGPSCRLMEWLLVRNREMA